MDSTASGSTPPEYRRWRRFGVTQPVTDRIDRALSQELGLLHRSDSLFYVLGNTGNVYSVELSSSPSCTCPDQVTPCKHILFVFIRVLGVSLEDTCLESSTLSPGELHSLLATPTLQEALAGANLRERFHQLFFGAGKENAWESEPVVEIKDGSTCPVCLEEMVKGERVMGCGTCRNVIHEECWRRWKRSRGGRSASCVICRSSWRDGPERDQEYLNLA